MAPKKKPAAAAASPATRTEARVYRANTVPSLSEWSVDRVRRALRQLAAGHFDMAAMLVDAMTGDDRIGAVLATRVRGVLGLPLTFVEAGDRRRSGRASRLVEAAWWDMVPEDVQVELHTWGLMLGVVPAQLVWSTGDAWVPRVKVWHPSSMAWDEEAQDYFVQTRDAGRVRVDTESGEWLLYTPGGDSRPWMGGLVRQLAIPWLIRQFGTRDWARYSEVHGLPIRKGRVPAKATEENKAAFLEQLADLGSESVVLLPQGAEAHESFDVLLEEAKGDSWEGFERLRAAMATDTAIAVLGQNLTTEVQGGSYAAATVHDNVRQDVIEADVQALSTGLRNGVLRHWARWNLGADALAPWPTWDTSPPADPLVGAQTVKAQADAAVAMVAAARAAGLPIDLAELAERLNIPLREGAEVPDELPELAPPAQEDDNVDETTLSRRGTPVTLASGDPVGKAQGFLYGMNFVERVEQLGRAAGAEALAPDVAELLELVKASTSYEDLQGKLADHLARRTPEVLAERLEAAIVLAELAGHAAVLEDL